MLEKSCFFTLKFFLFKKNLETNNQISFSKILRDIKLHLNSVLNGTST